MRPRYQVLPHEGGGYGVWLRVEGARAEMVSYRIRLEDAERLKRQLNGEVEKVNGGPTETGLPLPQQE